MNENPSRIPPQRDGYGWTGARSSPPRSSRPIPCAVRAHSLALCAICNSAPVAKMEAA